MLPSRRGILGCTVVVHRQLARSLRRPAVSSSVRCTQDTHRPGSSPTHRIYIAPESRRTVTFSPPRWRQHFCHSVCCIWQAYVTAFGLAPGLTGQRLPFTSWLLGSVTRRHCGAVSLSRPKLSVRSPHPTSFSSRRLQPSISSLPQQGLSFLSRPGGGDTFATAYAAYGRPMSRHLA